MRPIYSADQIYDMCLQICKDEDSKSMQNLVDVISDDYYLYDTLDLMHIQNTLNHTLNLLCCA